ncbi:MAG: C2 family cysteine protease [Myxococcales bacterium]
MKNLKWIGVLVLTAACGAVEQDGLDSDTDDLSSTTFSMEMVRANPSLLPNVTPPKDVRVDGRARQETSIEGAMRQPLAQPGDFLYTVNQLGQFLQLPDPAVHHDDKGDATYSRQPGDLFEENGKLDWLDVEQGHLGDCYFAASLAAVLYADNGKALSQNMIVPRLKNGKIVSYYATFHQASGRKVRVEVDPDLLHRNTNGHVLYMRNTQTRPGYEAWSTSLIEKAYAKWHGSYEKIGNGGTAADAIHALTGKTTRYYDASDSSVIPAIEKAGKEGRAQVACTYGEHSGVKYPVGIYADHCYTLRGIHRVGAKVFVQLRNPWGPGSASDAEPTEPPTDGVPDALFEISQADFARLYNSVDIVP